MAFAVLSYLTFAQTLRNRTDAFIRDGLTVFGRELQVERRVFPSAADAIRATISEVRFQDLDIAVLDDAGGVIAMSAPPLNASARSRHALPDDSALVFSAVREGRTADGRALTVSREVGYRVLSQPQPLDGRVLLLVGVYPLVEVQTTLGRIRAMFLVAIPLLIASAATGGSFLAKRSFKPVSSMAGRAAEIGATTLHERLPIAADDELGALARVLNDLLDRLEGAFAQQRRFMADASHELRTPAAVLRAEADVTLARAHRTEEEYRESMAVVQDAARRLTRIVDDIFLLARADAGHLVMHPGELYLEDVVHDTVRAVRLIADRRGVRLELGDMVEARYRGDAHLLGRVLLNLLDNAIKYSPPGTQVEVAMTRHNGRIDISVVDEGPGIPGEAQARIFERFFRVDAARSRAEESATSGAGLGLPIARRIAEMHGGHLTLVESRPGRTEFRLSLPRIPS
ncbi:MAG TPA: ATP-binding protein [Gemmatimonadaceae bacterium]|nr:ATP-binding protein [Gemmatimonadaceae bacterium]